MTGWTPDGWRRATALQQPAYADAAALAAVEARLAAAAPVVDIAGCKALRAVARDPAAFLLQGGDCAESFDDPVGERVAALSALFDGMLARLHPVSGIRPIAVARIAGQFAKPRSAEVEWVAGRAIPAYRGDIINSDRPEAAARAADPGRMLRAYVQSVGAAASLAAARTGQPPIFTSHEALLLPYEQALTRRGEDGRWWATSGHMLWVGDRTRQPDGAHVTYLAGIANMIGVKCGPAMSADDLLALAERLDPAREAGRLVLIARFGAERIEAALPPLLRAARRVGLAARWAIDPMHGNTQRHGERKVRRLIDIVAEIDAFFSICRSESVRPGGIHLEMSALDVTECLGGPGPASLGELDRNWRSRCDPRLNRAQTLEVTDRVATRLAAIREQV